MYKWHVTMIVTDTNGTKRKSTTVTATDKQKAIEKATNKLQSTRLISVERIRA